MPDLAFPEGACVLVTGGCGFIGSALLRRLVPAHPATRFVNLDLLTYAGHPLNVAAVADAANYTFVRGDVADPALAARLFAEHGVTHVAHLAAESHVDRSIADPLAFVRTNVVGTAVLLDAARRAWEGAAPGTRRFLHVSTDEVFGALADDDPPFSETTPYDPRSPYSASKAGADHLARAYAHTFGLPVVLTNCSNNYGPFQYPEKLIPLTITRAAAGEPIPVYGRGANVRDWLHVDDHAAALERALLAGRDGATYLIGGHGERRNLDLVHALCDAVDAALGRAPGAARALVTFVADRPGHDFRYAIDPARATAELGWTPAHALEDGLAATVRWYLEHPDWLAAVRDDAYRAYLDAQYAHRLAPS